MKAFSLLPAIVLLAVFVACYSSPAAVKNKNSLQRQVSGFFDQQENTLSNVEFYTTNYGTIFLNVREGKGGCFWPRGSLNQYLFGGGLWFAAMKKQSKDDLTLRKYVTVTYNPNNGRSWMVPADTINDIDYDEDEDQRFRCFFSSDFDEEGKSVNGTYDYNWPLWLDQENNNDEYLGTYVPPMNPSKRNISDYPVGPAYYSDEDIFCTYHDGRLEYYDGGYSYRRNLNYPLGIQYQERIYSWDSEILKDVLIISYRAINYSEDTLHNCYMAPVIDFDIAHYLTSQAGAQNDMMRYYIEDTTLNLAAAWTMPDRGEGGEGFGYVGFSFLRGPKTNGGSGEYALLNTLRFWPIENDILEDAQRYDFISFNDIEMDTEAGDYRLLMSTGPFDVLPGDTADMFYLISFANTSLGDEADGSTEDMQGLVDKVRYARNHFFNNMITSIEQGEPGTNEDFRLYETAPNPADDYVNIELYTPAPGDMSIKIYDFTGNICYSFRKYLSGGRQGVRIPVGGLASGAYTLVAQFEGKTRVKPLHILR